MGQFGVEIVVDQRPHSVSLAGIRRSQHIEVGIAQFDAAFRQAESTGRHDGLTGLQRRQAGVFLHDRVPKEDGPHLPFLSRCRYCVLYLAEFRYRMDGLGWRQEFVLFCRPVAQDVADAQGTADMADIDGPAAADCSSRQSQLDVFVLPGRRAVLGLRQAEPVGPLGVVGFTDAVLFQRLVRDEPTPLVFDDFQVFDGFIRDRIGYGRYIEGRVRRLGAVRSRPIGPGNSTQGQTNQGGQTGRPHNMVVFHRHLLLTRIGKKSSILYNSMVTVNLFMFRSHCSIIPQQRGVLYCINIYFLSVPSRSGLMGCYSCWVSFLPALRLTIS